MSSIRLQLCLLCRDVVPVGSDHDCRRLPHSAEDCRELPETVRMAVQVGIIVGVVDLRVLEIVAPFLGRKE